MAYFRYDIDIIGFFLLGGMKMSGSAGLFNKKTKNFTSSGAQGWAEREMGNTKKKYGHPIENVKHFNIYSETGPFRSRYVELNSSTNETADEASVSEYQYECHTDESLRMCDHTVYYTNY